MPDAAPPVPDWDARRATAAEAVVKNLRCESKALEEVAVRFRPGEPAHLVPIIAAGAEIIRAAACGLLDGIIDLPSVGPETRTFIAKLTPRDADQSPLETGVYRPGAGAGGMPGVFNVRIRIAEPYYGRRQLGHSPYRDTGVVPRSRT